MITSISTQTRRKMQFVPNEQLTVANLHKQAAVNRVVIPRTSHGP